MIWGLACASMGCQGPAPAAEPLATPRRAPPERAPSWRLEVVAVHPHDPRAFTQGLLFHGGRLYESTGLVGHSELREVDLATGRVLRRAALPPPHFGEGLARVGERLIQLTWQSEVAWIWDLASFAKRGEVLFRGEGWGLTFDGRHLIQSDGSSTLWFRDPESFAPLRQLEVHEGPRPQTALNELEWAEGRIWANVWLMDRLVAIDPQSGALLARVDAFGLLDESERAAADVMNGIAYDPERKLFYVTGKFWPKLFEVRLLPP